MVHLPSHSRGRGGFPAWAKAAKVDLPFANGAREWVANPQKRPILRLTTRPPQLESLFAAFNEGVTSPQRHVFLALIPDQIPPDESWLTPEAFRLRVRGAVKRELAYAMAELKAEFEPVGQAVWLASVAKMREKYRAPLSADKVDARGLPCPPLRQAPSPEAALDWVS